MRSRYKRKDLFWKSLICLISFQRLANLWTNKGYDLVFKMCSCDCGHGSIRKDPDFVAAQQPAPAPEPGGGGEGVGHGQVPDGAVGGAPAQPQPQQTDKKKKKKEKTNLKPKLNFNPQNVSGSYFGSNRQKEDDELEAGVRQARRRQSSSDQSDSSAIPGLATQTPPPLAPATVPPPPAPVSSARRRSVSEAAEEAGGWVKVSSGSRRGSKSQSDYSSRSLDDSLSSKSRSVTPSSVSDPPPSQTVSAPQPPPPSIQIPPPAPESPVLKVTQLPMFQPPSSSDRFSDSSSLIYETGVQAPIGTTYGGARPKFSPSAFSDEVYQSDEDIPWSQSQQWPESSKGKANPDREMEDLFEQTKMFQREMNALSPESARKRDSNGFYNCSSCKTVHSSLEEYSAHTQSSQHQRAEKLANDLLSITSLKDGWESINVRRDIWSPQSSDKLVKGVTEEQFENFKTELRQFRDKLEEERKMKEKMTEDYDELKRKYEAEVADKEIKDKKFKDYKMEALRLAKEEKVIFETRINEGQKQVVEMKGIIDSLTKELLVVKELAGNKQNQGVSSEKDISELTEAFEEKEKKMKGCLEEAEQVILQLKQEGEDHEEKRKELEAENKDLTTKNAGYLKEILSLSKHVEDATKTMGEQNEVVKILKKDNKEAKEQLKQKSNELKKLIQTHSETLKVMNKKCGDLEKELQTKKKDVTNAEVSMENLKSLQEKYENERIKVGKLNEKVEEMRVQNSTIENLLIKCQKEKKVLVETVKELEKNIVDVEKNTDDMEARLKDEMRKKIVAELELKKLKDSLHANEEMSSEPDHVHQKEAKDNLFEQLLDETHAARKKKEEAAVNPRQELTTIINDSIKDDALRNCLTSIIKEEDNKDDPISDNGEEPMTDPYDTLDRFPQPGLDDEIDPYLGEDKPGEFDDEESGDEFESSEEGVDNDGDTTVPENLLDRVKEETWVQEAGEGAEGECKRFEDMTDEEMAAHWRLISNMTAEEVFSTAPEQTTEQRLLALGGDDDDDKDDGHDQEPASVRTESSVVGASDSTDNDCSSLASDTTVPLSDCQEDPVHDSCPPSDTAAPLSDRQDNLCPPRPQPQDDGKVSALEATVSRLQSMVMGLAAQVTTLTNKMDDSNFEAGLLGKTVEMLQQKNSKLTETVGDLEARNNLLESNLVEVSKHVSSHDNVKGLQDSFLEILSSCENFQTSFDSMADRQDVLEAKLSTVTSSVEGAKVDTLELKEDFNKLADKFSSLQLEYQVDKSQAKVQMDNLAYNLAMLGTNKVTVPESVSSTSGVKSDDAEDDDLDKVGSLAFLDLKENVTPNTKEPAKAKTKTKESKKGSGGVVSSGASTLVPAPATVFPAGAVYAPGPRYPSQTPVRFPALPFYPGMPPGQTTAYSGQHIIYQPQPGASAILPPHQIFYR